MVRLGMVRLVLVGSGMAFGVRLGMAMYGLVRFVVAG